MLSAALLKSPLLYLSAALLLALTALAFSYQHNKLLKAEKATLVQQVASLKGELVNSNAIAAECDAATKAAKAIADDQKAQLDAAVARTVTLAKQIATTRAALRAKEDSDHALPDCQNLLAVDLAAVCPGHTAAVRVRNFPGALQGPGNTSPGSGQDAH